MGLALPGTSAAIAAMEHATTYTWKDVCAERSRRQKAVRVQKKVGSQASTCFMSLHPDAFCPPPLPDPSPFPNYAIEFAGPSHQHTDCYCSTCIGLRSVKSEPLQHAASTGHAAQLNPPRPPAQEEIHHLEQQVAALQEMLGRAQLQSVQQKAELETLNRFAAARKAQLNATDRAGDAEVCVWRACINAINTVAEK